MPTQISDLWVPDIWIPTIRERQATFPSLLNSGIATPNGQFDSLASGPANDVNVPFFKDITDQNDEIQVEDTAPAVDNKITAGVQKAPILNRVTKTSSTALAAQISGSRPVAEITSQLGERRQKQRQKTLLAFLRGALGSAGASGGAGALSAMRVDLFDEQGNDAGTDGKLFSPELFIQGKALFGELADDLQGGALWMHPNVVARLESLDLQSFKNGVESGLPFTVRTYRGIPIFTSEALVRAGTTNGFVYETYFMVRGIIARGEKPQMGDVIDVSSLSYDKLKDKNTEVIYDRTRFLMHLNGMKWIGTPAGQTATNAELATTTNWQYLYQTANRAGVTCIRTNG